MGDTFVIVNSKTGECIAHADSYDPTMLPAGFAPPRVPEGHEIRKLDPHPDPGQFWRYDPKSNTRVPDPELEAREMKALYESRLKDQYIRKAGLEACAKEQGIDCSAELKDVDAQVGELAKRLADVATVDVVAAVRVP